MVQGRRQSEWGQTATIVAMLANQSRDKKKRSKPFEPSDFMPDLDGSKPQAAGVIDRSDAKAMFGKGKASIKRQRISR
jgi:hypothetical protein